MTLVHGSNEVDKAETPYEVTASSHTYNSGDRITVSLEASNGTYFKEFLLQARTVPGNAIVGHFIVTDPKTQVLKCGGIVDSSVREANSVNKTHISALWIAPAMTGKVHFRAAVVESMRTFWVGVESSMLTNVQSTNISSIKPMLASNATSSILNTSKIFSNSPSSDTCGTQKLCLTAPSDCDPSKTRNCYFMSSTLMSDGAYYFEISGPSDGFVLFGFSDDQLLLRKLELHSQICSNPFFYKIDPSPHFQPKFAANAAYVVSWYAQMDQLSYDSALRPFVSGKTEKSGNDDIYICRINSTGQVDIQHAYSEGKSQLIIIPLINVETRLLSYTNGVIQCSFLSRNQISTQPFVPQLRSSNNISSMYYILAAHGPSVNGEIGLHEADVFASDNKVNLSAVSNVTHTEHKGSILVKTHGALMLVAWMTTGSLGMILARYLKVAGKKLVFGKAIWFESHVVLMFLTVAATITSFVLAFVEAAGWTYDISAHAVLGCLVMILSLLQPVFSFFRPPPQSSKRFIFNWFHCNNALLIKVLAVANLFLGFQFLNHNVDWLVNVMAGFCGWEGLAFILFELNAGLAQREIKKEVKEESTKVITQPPVKFEYFLLAIYLCGNLAFLITLFVGIGQA
ncbi:putative ferric-chelate reductase 1 [Gastrophryne carolinensis]